jgi:hypothetical protein
MAFETPTKVLGTFIMPCIFELPTLKVMKIMLQVIELVLMHLFTNVNMCVFGRVRTCINLNMWISLSKE